MAILRPTKPSLWSVQMSSASDDQTSRMSGTIDASDFGGRASLSDGPRKEQKKKARLPSGEKGTQ